MTAWRKSSYSGAGGTDNCIELARITEAVGIRDSKDPDGGHLALGHAAFADLLTRVKRDELASR
ncbi:DUF397 domain-containing protein [Actinomadura sp. WMMB 499]|uniref:DUF397 domain-containing protein n=1 Tax=Actinomadura sp. WMMB 499 TaxID=1219491 RepID=UPI001247AE71|nr:DUF397 domain-containing protein [Actinomadura sp. WMMB 499]QFG24491.1 DUF397 domain-containing protein [Actinomadura sp. WMMB 499]